MMVRVMGASAAAIRQIRAIAPRGVDVVDEAVAEPDWVLVATRDQRIEAIASTGLAPFRVVEVPEIAGNLDQSATDALRTALIQMAGIGVWRTEQAGLGAWIAAMVVRRMAKRLVLSTSVDAVPIGIGVSGVRTRIPAGPQLDELLRDRAVERARRFASHTVRLD